ncbi:hypothetical protein [Microbispora sp. NPDC049125]|uniref:hypothetical protein n=1 Tax=Microbispora sp. NPDC049125 TaxID=3154929 RepID=UPI00346595D8
MRSTSSAVDRAAVGVYAGLAAQVASMAALTVFEEARGGRLAGQIAAFGGDPGSPAARHVAGAATVFAVLVLLVAATTAATGLTYLTWLRRVRPGVPGPALAAAWLVPGVNLVMPPVLADHAWRDAAPASPAVRAGGLRAGGGAVRFGGGAGQLGGGAVSASGPGREAGPPGHAAAPGRVRWLVLLTCWWLSSLAALFLVLAGPSRPGAGLTGIGLPELAATAIAALLCAATVREITVLDASGPAGIPARRSTVRPAASGSGRLRAVRHRHQPAVGPELPELACQIRRGGSPGRPAFGGAPLSE